MAARYLSVEDAAKKLGITKKAVVDAIQNGSLAARGKNGFFEMTEKSLERFQARSYSQGARLLKKSDTVQTTMSEFLEIEDRMDSAHPVLSKETPEDVSEAVEDIEDDDLSYSELVFELISVRMEEDAARTLWNAVATHQTRLIQRLKRPIDLRVALLDYLSVHPGSKIQVRLITQERFKFLTANALRDRLTNLYTRSVLDDMLQKEWSLHAGKSALSIIMCDIDHFKELNDTYGHQTGDHVLKKVALVLESQCRFTDFCVRYGGEEFLLFMIHTSLDEALLLARRIQKKVRALDDRFGVPRKMTMSFGVVDNSAAADAYDLIRQADLELYRAKRTGRDKICHPLLPQKNKA